MLVCSAARFHRSDLKAAATGALSTFFSMRASKIFLWTPAISRPPGRYGLPISSTLSIDCFRHFSTRHRRLQHQLGHCFFRVCWNAATTPQMKNDSLVRSATKAPSMIAGCSSETTWSNTTRKDTFLSGSSPIGKEARLLVSIPIRRFCRFDDGLRRNRQMTLSCSSTLTAVVERGAGVLGLYIAE